MLEPLRQIPGPTFLLLFTAAWLLSMVVAYLWIRIDGTRRLPLPEWTDYDPTLIAYIRGGHKAVAETILFSLAERGIIVFKGTDSKGYDLIERTYQRKLMLNMLELEVYKACEVGTSVENVRLGITIQGVIDPVRRKLEDERLVRTSNERYFAWGKLACALFALLTLGGAKIALGIANDKPVGFLLQMMIFFPIITVLIFSKVNMNPTTLGRKILKELEEHYGWLRDNLKDGRSPYGINPAFGVAVFGAAALKGSDKFSTIHHALTFTYTESSSGCSGCSSCGGCGGGCGGCG